MKSYKTIFVVLTLVLITGIGSAQEISPYQVTNSENIEVGEIQKQSLLDKALSFTLAFVPAEDKEVVNNEEIQIPFEVTTTKSSFVGGNYRFNIEIYDCSSSDCADQTLIESTTIGNSFGTFTTGQTFSGPINYQVPENINGEFAVNTYIWDEVDGERASTISVTQYTVVDPSDGDGTGSGDDQEENIDSDGDGVVDIDDECPETYGEKDNGCPINSEPDSDGDGVVNSEDQCTYTYGSGVDGCPVDSDGDGVNDRHDACENTPGPASNNGCPTDGGGESSLSIINVLLAGAGLIIVIGGVVYYRG